jgi:hypothetical protein
MPQMASIFPLVGAFCREWYSFFPLLNYLPWLPFPANHPEKDPCDYSSAKYYEKGENSFIWITKDLIPSPMCGIQNTSNLP